MAELSGAEFKVLLYIARRTYGFGKESDRISLSQISEGITKRDGTALDHGTGISRSSVKRALNTLESLGMVTRNKHLTETGKDFDENTYSINLAWEPGSQTGGNSSSSSDLDGKGLGLEGVSSKSAHPAAKPNTQKEVGPKSAYLGSRSDGGLARNEPGVGPKSATQETDQETVQETASVRGTVNDQANNADDGYSKLVAKLIAYGVGRSIAEQLAREKPDDCCRHLEYLPFVKLKSTSGAYLANAIRKGYGPPPGFGATKKDQPRERSKRQRDEPTTEKARREVEHREKMLKQKYAELEASEPAAISEFLAFAESERTRTERIAKQLSARHRNDILSGLEDERSKLERFERWLASTQSQARRMIGPAASSG